MSAKQPGSGSVLAVFADVAPLDVVPNPIVTSDTVAVDRIPASLMVNEACCWMKGLCGLFPPMLPLTVA